jgi:hypothetical protein
MPTYSNDEGRCVLLNKDGKRFDQFDYTDRMHYPLLDNKDGVSLERIDFNRPTDDASNWTSASSTSGYGTPTYQNSQYAKAFNTNNDLWQRKMSSIVKLSYNKLSYNKLLPKTNR